MFFSPTSESQAQQQPQVVSVSSARNVLASVQLEPSTSGFSPQANLLKRKRPEIKPSFYKGNMPKVSIPKEKQRRVVALDYPGVDVPEVDGFRDNMVVFDGLINIVQTIQR